MWLQLFSITEWSKTGWLAIVVAMYRWLRVLLKFLGWGRGGDYKHVTHPNETVQAEFKCYKSYLPIIAMHYHYDFVMQPLVHGAAGGRGQPAVEPAMVAHAHVLGHVREEPAAKEAILTHRDVMNKLAQVSSFAVVYRPYAPLYSINLSPDDLYLLLYLMDRV